MGVCVEMLSGKHEIVQHMSFFSLKRRRAESFQDVTDRKVEEGPSPDWQG